MKRVVIAFAFFVFAGAAAFGRYEIDRSFSRQPAYKEVFNLPPGRVLRQMDLGWHTLAADLLFLRANIYYGHHILTDEELPWLDSFIDALLELDPDFKAVYFWGSLVSRFRRKIADNVPEQFIQRSNAILERGLRRFPDDYRFPMRIAYNYYYELGKIADALPYFEAASRLPGAPNWLAEKLVDIYRKRGERETAIKILEHLIASTEDPVLAQGLKDRLLALLERQQSEKLVAERQAIMENWQREFPYISFDLYLTIRPQD